MANKLGPGERAQALARARLVAVRELQPQKAALAPGEANGTEGSIDQAIVRHGHFLSVSPRIDLITATVYVPVRLV